MGTFLTKTANRIWVSFLLALFVVASLAGCGNVDENEKALKEAMTNINDYIYSQQTIITGEELEGRSMIYFLRSGEEFFAFCSKSLYEGGTDAKIFKIDGEGNHELYQTLIYPEGLCAQQAVMDKDKNIYVVLQSETEAAYFAKYNSAGELVFNNSFSDYHKIDPVEFGNIYVSNIYFAEDSIYVLTTMGVIIFDLDGNLVNALPKSMLDSKIKDIYSFGIDDTGRMYTFIWGESETTDERAVNVYELQKGTLNILSSQQIVSNNVTSSLYLGYSYDFLGDINGGIYGYNLEDGKIKKLMDYVASGFECGYTSGLIELPDNKIFWTGADSLTYSSCVMLLTKINPEDVPVKKDITVGMLNTNYLVRSQVYSFNKNSLEYRVNLIDYSSLYSGSQADRLKQLNKDISAGSMPDILVVDDSLPIDNFIMKGLLQDFRPFLEEDPDYSIDLLLPGLVNAYSYKGALYQLVPNFTVSTLCVPCKSSDDIVSSWTPQEAIAYWEKQGTDKMFDPGKKKIEFLNECISCAGDYFVDWENGVCRFDTPEFINLLELSNMIRDEEIEELKNGDYFARMSSWRNNEALVYGEPLRMYNDYNSLLQALFGCEVDFRGYPCGEGSGTCFRPYINFAMSAQSQVKDGAWEFVRYFLSEDFLLSDNNYVIPSRMDLLTNIEEQATHLPSYTDFETGEKVEYMNSTYINGQMLEYGAMSLEQAQRFTDFITHIDKAYESDGNINAIIAEETDSYFRGRKSAEETAKVIQSRASIYLNENIYY